MTKKQEDREQLLFIGVLLGIGIILYYGFSTEQERLQRKNEQDERDFIYQSKLSMEVVRPYLDEQAKRRDGKYAVLMERE